MTRRVLTATLDHPVGINRTYAPGSNDTTSWIYKKRGARDWQDYAIVCMRMAGWKLFPPGEYEIRVTMTLFTMRADIDSGIKATLDAIQKAIGINDTRVVSLHVNKVVVSSPDLRRMDVEVVVEGDAHIPKVRAASTKAKGQAGAVRRGRVSTRQGTRGKQ